MTRSKKAAEKATEEEKVRLFRDSIYYEIFYSSNTSAQIRFRGSSACSCSGNLS